MSRLFNQWYFSAANNYGCEETYNQRRDEEINAAWEKYEMEKAGEDLTIGIAEENLPEFVWIDNKNLKP